MKNLLILVMAFGSLSAMADSYHYYCGGVTMTVDDNVVSDVTIDKKSVHFRVLPNKNENILFTVGVKKGPTLEFDGCADGYHGKMQDSSQKEIVNCKCDSA